MTRVSVVSGGGTGMGKAITARLVGDGDHVVIIGRRAHVLEMTAEELNTAGPGKVSWQAADLSSPQDAERAAAAVEGSIDVLVNNAGGSHHAACRLTSWPRWPGPGTPTTRPTSSQP